MLVLNTTVLVISFIHVLIGRYTNENNAKQFRSLISHIKEYELKTKRCLTFGTINLNTLEDVNLSINPTNNQALTYDSGTSKWNYSVRKQRNRYRMDIDSFERPSRRFPNGNRNSISGKLEHGWLTSSCLKP